MVFNFKCALFGSLLCIVSGCSFIIQPALVPNRNVGQWTVADPNNYGITMTKQEDGSLYCSWNIDCDYDPNNSTIPYSGSIMNINPATVKGQLNGRTYDVIFDTGNNLGLMIEDSQITRHQLPVLFFNEKNKADSGGFAFANTIDVGPLHFENYPCAFIKHHAEHRLLGVLPIHRFEWILLPLQIICSLGHIEFNQITNSLRIDPDKPFSPQDETEWISFPFVIENNKLLLKIPLEKIETTLFVDTGANYQMELNSQTVEKLFDKRLDLRKAWKWDAKTYFPYAGGLQTAKQFTAKNVQFGQSMLCKLNIVIEPESVRKNPLFDGAIGLGLFRKTVMVLDFKQNLMWVKKAKGSRFEDVSKESI